MINQNPADYLQRHEQFLQQLLENRFIPSAQLKTAMVYALIPGGKRLRPHLVYLMGELVNVPLSCLDAIAASIELTHCYSLVHDDLPAMDNDDLRRGKPSCHKAFDEATAILVGDGMQALAIELLLEYLPATLPPEKVINITKMLVKASGVDGMVSGQSLDLLELSDPALNEARLKMIHQLKTGQLIEACAEMVLAASDATADERQALQTYTRLLGLVFQMQDDYLDLYAEPAQLGKGRASDQANHKNTYTRFYTQQDLQALITRHYQQAKDSLARFGQRASCLLELTTQLMQRHP